MEKRDSEKITQSPEQYESRASITVVQQPTTTKLSSEHNNKNKSKKPVKNKVSFSNSVQVQDIPSNEDNRMNSIRLEIGSPSAMPVTV